MDEKSCKDEHEHLDMLHEYRCKSVATTSESNLIALSHHWAWTLNHFFMYILIILSDGSNDLGKVEAALNKKYIKQKLQHGLTRIWQVNTAMEE